MNELKFGNIPDGRIRLLRLLTESQIEALRNINIDGLIMLNRHEVNLAQPETWLEYWIDKDKITEDELRARIEDVLKKA
jgi:hypothetical protein